jgi:hypothetical protein
MAPILSAEHVTKSFSIGRGPDVVAVHDVSLAIDEGELVACSAPRAVARPRC